MIIVNIERLLNAAPFSVASSMIACGLMTNPTKKQVSNATSVQRGSVPSGKSEDCRDNHQTDKKCNSGIKNLNLSDRGFQICRFLQRREKIKKTVDTV